MARKGILYEQVTDAIRALQSDHHKVTVRAIHAVTGGSMSTVLKHYRRWQSEQLGHTADSTEISPQLAEALHTELHNYARRALLTMETRLSGSNQKLKDAEAAHRLAQCHITELENALQAAQKSPATKMAEVEGRLQRALRDKTHTEEALQQARRHASLMVNRLAEADARLEILSQELIIAQEQVLKSAVIVKELEQRLKKPDRRSGYAEAQLQELPPQEKSRPPRNNAPSPKPATAKPALQEQQEAFKF